MKTDLKSIILVTVFASMSLSQAKEPRKIAGAGAPAKSLFDAARSGNLAAVKQHLAQGAEVNAVDADGYSPLMYAAASLSGFQDTLLPIAKELIKKNADVNLQTPTGDTALTLAAAFPTHIKIAKALITAGADVNAELPDTGMTPLLIAAANNNLPLVQLLAKKADLENKSTYGVTALMFAAEEGQPEMVAALLGAGADVNAQDSDGNNALIGVARIYADMVDDLTETKKKAYHAIIKMLHDAGANAKQKNNEGKSFTDYVKNVPELQSLAVPGVGKKRVKKYKK